MNEYLAAQFSGELVQDTINTIQSQYELSQPILDYWESLSIEAASDDDLTSIGYIVGVPWPTAPDGTLDSNSFRLGEASSYPTFSIIGLSGVGLLSGGLLSSALPSPNNKVPSPVYRKILLAIAYAKWHGLSWTTIDAIASSFGTTDYVYRNSSYNQFTLGTSATYPIIDNAKGLSGVGMSIGGRFQSIHPDWYPVSDITIAFITPLSNANLWICQQIFQSICTAPQVFILNGA